MFITLLSIFSATPPLALLPVPWPHCTSAAARGSVKSPPTPYTHTNSRVNCGLGHGPLPDSLSKPLGEAGPLAETWGRKSCPVRFQTKKVGLPRTCSQPAKARAEMRWWGRGLAKGRRGREKRGGEEKDAKGVLREWRRHLSLEGLQRQVLGEAAFSTRPNAPPFLPKLR